MKDYNPQIEVYKVFSERVANELVTLGFNPIRRELNKFAFGRYVYCFENTLTFYTALMDVVRRLENDKHNKHKHTN